MTAVRRVDMPLEELTSKILGLCGKNPRRVKDILERGTLVSGDSRFRWMPVSLATAELDALLGRFPNHEPGRAFDAAACKLMRFCGPGGNFEISREAGRQKKVFRRRAFWGEALAEIELLSPLCERYSYSGQADVFAAALTPRTLARLRPLGKLLRFSALESHVRRLDATRVVLHVSRE